MEQGIGKLTELFGVSEVDFQEINTRIMLVLRREQNINMLADELGLRDDGVDGKVVLSAVLFGRIVEKNDQRRKMAAALEELQSELVRRFGGDGSDGC